MKLITNQGPYVGGVNHQVKISIEHCKQIDDFLWRWAEALPEKVSSHIVVITVNPTSAHGVSSIEFKVVISGVYEHRLANGGIEKKTWECSFVETDFYHKGQTGKLLFEISRLKEKLTEGLLRILQKERETFLTTTEYLGSLVEAMEQNMPKTK